jgi:hypothetical protein
VVELPSKRTPLVASCIPIFEALVFCIFLPLAYTLTVADFGLTVTVIFFVPSRIQELELLTVQCTI